MELSLQSLSARCHVTGRDFAEGDRVASYLVRIEPAAPGAPDITRHDVLASEEAAYRPTGQIACRWLHVVKARKTGESPKHTLKLTAETLFLTLADPAAERSIENERLLQVLALMLERKRVLRPRGRTADGRAHVYEHAKNKTLHEVAAAELSPEFFLSIQHQLSVLVGSGPRPTADEAPAT